MKFNNQEYKFVQTVSYLGRTFTFAAVGHGGYDNIYYSFCDSDGNLESESDAEEEVEKKDSLDQDDDSNAIDNCWTYPMALDFPMEVRRVGLSLLTQPVVDPTSKLPATSIVLAAQEPFQIIVDNLNLWIFRSGSDEHSILADRFIFDNTNKRLLKANEVRFAHSGHPDIPANNRDNYSASDPNGDSFVEPTIRLVVDSLIETNFAALLIPNSVNSKHACWHFFLKQNSTNKLLHYVIPYTERTWFDLSNDNSLIGDDMQLVNHDIIEVSNHTLKSPSAILYEQQETIFTDTGEQQLVQRAVRAMLIVHATNNNTCETTLAALDFSVGIDGGLTKIGENLFLNLGQIEDYNVALTTDGRGDAVAMNSYVNAADQTNNAFVSVWVKWNGPNQAQSNQIVVHLVPQGSSSTNESLFLGIDNEGYPYLCGGVSSTNNTFRINSPTKLIEGQWTNLAFSIGNDASTNGNAYIWFNGLCAASKANTTTTFFQQNYTVVLGKALTDNTDNESGNEFFYGSFAQFYLLDEKVNDENLFDSGLPYVFGASVDALGGSEPIIFWAFGEGKGTRLENSNSNYANLYGNLQGASWQGDVCPDQPSMPIVHVDSDYLNVRGALIDPISQTSSQALPASNVPVTMMKGAEGYLHVYFQDQNNQAAALHMSTIVERARFVVAQQVVLDSTGTTEWVDMLAFVSRQAGTSANQIEITLGTITDGYFDEVIFEYSSQYKETWRNVPARLDSFAQVINGEAVLPVENDGMSEVSSEQITTDWDEVIYDYTTNFSSTVSAGETFGSKFFEVCVPYGLLEQDPVLSLANPEELRWSLYGGRDCGWIMAPLQPALNLDGQKFNPYTENYQALDIAGDLTIQFWIQPINDTGTILDYQGDESAYKLSLNSGNIVAQRSGFSGKKDDCVTRSTTNAIALNDWTHIAAVYDASFALHLPAGVYVKCKNDERFNVEKGLTVESWVKFDPGSIETAAILSRRSFEEGKSSYELKVITDPDNQSARELIFKVYLANGDSVKLHKSFNCPANEWVHLAANYQPSYSYNYLSLQDSDKNYVQIAPFTEKILTTFTIEMYIAVRDSEKQAFISQGRVNGADSTTNHFQIGILNSNEGVSIEIEDEHITISTDDWNPSSSTKDVWHFLSVVVETDDDSSYVTVYLDGVIPSLTNGFMAYRAPIKKLEGGDSVDFYPWTIGAEYDIDGSVGNFADLSIAQARIWTSARTKEQILSNLRDPLIGNETSLGAYLVFDAPEGSQQNVIINRVDNSECPIIPDDIPHWHIKEISGGGNLFVNGKIVTSYSNNDANNSILATDTILTMGRRAVIESGGEQRHLNGSIENVRLWSSFRTSPQIDFFRNNPLPDPENQIGLVAQWNFDEAEGNVVHDPVGGHNGKIVGMRFAQLDDTAILWEPTIFDANWTIYVNGELVEMTPRELLDNAYESAPSGLLLGDSYKNTSDTLKAYLSELQFRNQLLTKDVIFRDMHQPQAPDDNLKAYYRFNDGSSKRITDYSGNANDLDATTYKRNDIDPSIIWAEYNDGTSNLNAPPPIRDEDLAVINITNGYIYPKAANLRISSSPSVIEDFVNQTRIYSWIIAMSSANDELFLSASVPLAETELIYLGQVQYKPRLIGYIEGAPPVPSENLTIDAPSNPDRYLNNSSVFLEISNSVQRSATSSLTTDIGTNAAISAGTHNEISTGQDAGSWNGPPGGGIWYGLEAKTVESTFDKAVKGNVDLGTSFSYQQDAGFDSATSKKYGASLDGGWENNCYKIPGDIDGAYDLAGKRLYRPNNMGVAIVKSRTADMFAMRSKKSKAMLGYTTVVNPEIPEDFNIINFKLNPKYVRNGCLDGYVGFDQDEYYTDLAPGEKGSYFKPKQAYKMKFNIERENEKAFSSLSQYNPFGGAANYYEKLNVSIANTYVWTADAGTFSEELSVSSSFSEQFSGGINAAASITGSIGGKVGVGWGFLTGATVGLDLMASATLKLSYAHKSGEGKAFSLNSNVNSEGFLNRVANFASWTQSLNVDQAENTLNSGAIPTSDGDIIYSAFKDHGITLTSKNRVESDSSSTDGPWRLIDLYVEYNITYDAENEEFIFAYFPTSTASSQYNVNYNYADGPCPGKVRGYRYMSLYLTPDKKNFQSLAAKGQDQIIDEYWLNSDDPDAIAMRQALAQENPIWRLLHRVTYVNRVPPLASEWGTGSPPNTEDVANKRPVRPDDHSIHHNSIIIYKVLSAILSTDQFNQIKNLDFDDIDFSSVDFADVSEALEAILDDLSIEGKARQVYFDEMITFFELLLSPD